MNEKRNYFTPIFDVISVDSSNVIRTSGEVDGSGMKGVKWIWED